MRLEMQQQRVKPRALADGVEVFDVDNAVGESPAWDEERQRLWWIDVRAPAVLCLEPDSGLLHRMLLPEPVGALALTSAGQLLLALRTHAHRYDPATRLLQPFAAVETDRPGNRLNDGKASPSGRWWLVGSMDDAPSNKQSRGGIYRIGADGQVLRLHDGLIATNGLAWSLDAKTLYFSCSLGAQIWTAPWDEEQGRMGTPRPFAHMPEEQGRPDGALVDAQDHYLSAGVSAGCLNRFSAQGALVQRRALPCRAPTMPCYGGASGQDLFVTSLRRPQWPGEPGGLDGQLFRLRDFGHGQPGARLRFGGA